MKSHFFALTVSLISVPAFAIPNPSALLCKQKGGTSVRIRTEQGAESALCKFGNGMIGEWTFFNEKHGDKTLAVKKFLAFKTYSPTDGGVKPGHGRLAPLDSYNCIKNEGTVEHYALRNNETIKTCRFSDNSTIETWTLVKGPHAMSKLAQAVR